MWWLAGVLAAAPGQEEADENSYPHDEEERGVFVGAAVVEGGDEGGELGREEEPRTRTPVGLNCSVGNQPRVLDR